MKINLAKNKQTVKELENLVPNPYKGSRLATQRERLLRDAAKKGLVKLVD